MIFICMKVKSFQINEFFSPKLCEWGVVKRILFRQLNSFSDFHEIFYKEKSNDGSIGLETFSQNIQLLFIKHPNS